MVHVARPGRDETPRPPLAEGEVRFVGDPVALVLAEDRYVAEDAADMVVVDYEPLTAVVDFLAAAEAPDARARRPRQQPHRRHDRRARVGGRGGVRRGRPRRHLDGGSAVPVRMPDGDARASSSIDNPGSGEITIYSATQAPHEVRAFASRLLGMPEHRVRVIMRDTGGGFGQKIMVMRDEMCVMLAAPKVTAPVKWIEDRRENLMAAGQSRHEHADARMAFDESGTIQAAQIDFV